MGKHTPTPWELFPDETHRHDIKGNGLLIATIWGEKEFVTLRNKIPIQSEQNANANLIITAVNVMPEVITLLRSVAEGQIKNQLRMQVLELRAAQILKQLEAVDVS